MLKSSLLRISMGWRLHSEQLRQWIAVSQNDVSKLDVARAYARELPWSDCVQDAEDCNEAVALLHRIGFSKDSLVFETLRREISDVPHWITKDTLRTITHSCEDDPRMFDCMSFVYLTPAGNAAAVRDAFEELTAEEKVHFARVFWRHSYSSPGEQRPEYWGVSNTIAASLTLLLSYAPRPPLSILRLLAEAGLPEADPNAKFLVERLVDVSTSLPENEKLELLEKLVEGSTRGRLASPWFSALRRGFDPVAGNNPLSRAEATLIFTVLLTKARAVPTEQEVRQAQQALILCKLETMASFCESLAGVSREVVEKWSRCVEAARLRALRIFNESGSLPEEKAMCILCLCYLSSPAAQTMIHKVLAQIDEFCPSPATAGPLLRCFALQDVYPSKFLSLLNSTKSLVEELPREDCVFLLYASIRANVPFTQLVVKKSCGKALGRQFTRRKSATGAHSKELTSTGWVTYVVSLGYLGGQRDGMDWEKVATNTIEEKVFSSRVAQLLLEALTKVSTPPSVQKAALTKGINLADEESSQEFLRTLLDSMSAANFRDVGGYEKALRCLKHSVDPLEPTTVLSAASAARALHLLPQFERSRLLETAVDLRTWNGANLIELAQMCSTSQRQWLMACPEVKKKLTKESSSCGSGSDKILLFNMLPDEDKKNVLNDLQHDVRLPIAGYLSVEDAVTALENAVKIDPNRFEIVFRVVREALDEANESQLMRVLRCLTQLPLCPNYAFRTLGRVILRLSESMSANNAVLWLSFYAKNRVRDDSVGKSLVRKASAKNANLSKAASGQLLLGAKFYGQAVRPHHKGRKSQQLERKRIH